MAATLRFAERWIGFPLSDVNRQQLYLATSEHFQAEGGAVPLMSIVERESVRSARFGAHVPPYACGASASAAAA
jgi:hypothetical protein